MSDLRLENMNFEKMDFKELRNAVKQCYKENILLRDELAIMKRKYEDLLYNLDYENFSSSVISDGKNMQTSIKQTAESVKIAAEKADEAEAKTAELEVTAEEIRSTVKAVEDDVSNLSSEISQTADNISLIIDGEYTEDILNNYLTGIEINPKNIKVFINGDSAYATFDLEGLKFFSGGQTEGWAIEPDENSLGGVLNYYFNNRICYVFGTGFSGAGYTPTDMTLKATVADKGRFVVDVTNSTNREIKFVGLNNNPNYEGDVPCIYANEKLLATVDWVEDYVSENGGGGGTVTAVFA